MIDARFCPSVPYACSPTSSAEYTEHGNLKTFAHHSNMMIDRERANADRWFRFPARNRFFHAFRTLNISPTAPSRVQRTAFALPVPGSLRPTSQEQRQGQSGRPGWLCAVQLHGAVPDVPGLRGVERASSRRLRQAPGLAPVRAQGDHRRAVGTRSVSPSTPLPPVDVRSWRYFVGLEHLCDEL